MDRTVAHAALTLQSIPGPDSVNDAYFRNYWGALDPASVCRPRRPWCRTTCRRST
jgi:hypothetical protein